MLLPAKESARLTNKRYPAMVVPIFGEDGLQGAHTTWLCQDATAKLAVSDGRVRRMYGKAKGGYAPLAKIDPDTPLIIGEGIERVLSVRGVHAITLIKYRPISALPRVR